MIRLLIAILIVLFFVLRDAVCFFFYPDMRTITSEWDASNALTMNIYSAILLLSFSKTFFKVKYELTYLFEIAVVWFSIADIADRLLGEYNFTGLDQVLVIPCCITLSTITHLLYVKYLGEKTTDEQ